MSNKETNIDIVLNSLNRRIVHGIGYDTEILIFQVVYGMDKDQDFLSIATIILDEKDSIIFKNKVIEAQNSFHNDVAFVASEIMILNLTPDITKVSLSLDKDELFNLNLHKDKLLEITKEGLDNLRLLKR